MNLHTGPGAGNVIKVTPETLVPNGDGTVTLAADFQLVKGPDLGLMTIVVPVNAGMVQVMPGTYAMVKLRG